MRLVRIGVAGVSVKVGDFAGNSSRLRAVIEAARDQGCNLLVTPELALSGYSLEDRVWWPDIARRSWRSLVALADVCRGISVFVGLPVHYNSMMYNAAALLHEGVVRGLIIKRILPSYSVFYEGRNWTAWREGAATINGVPAGDLVFRLPFGQVSAEICEDMWSPESPAKARVSAGAEIICNLSASPFTPMKNAQRRRRVLAAAERLACVYAYANLLGLDNSRLVFDGGGFIASPGGLLAEGPVLSRSYWTLTTGIVDLEEVNRARAENTTWRQYASRKDGTAGVQRIDAGEGRWAPPPLRDYVRQLPPNFFYPADPPMSETRDAAATYLDELYDALVLGLRDYFEKVGAFDRFLVAVSGGRDSALCLLLAVDAAKAIEEGRGAARYAERVCAVYLPNEPYSSGETLEAARALSEDLGVPFKVVSIAEEARIALARAGELMGDPGLVSSIAKQNLQARVRGSMMLNWANSARGLLLVTSNLSETAVGYTTTGGDNQGGYAPIANIPKTLVTRLIERVAQRCKLQSIAKILAIPPSAELAPDQRDEADLMPYVVLDDLLYLFAQRRMSLPDCWRILVHRRPEYDPEQLRAWTSSFGLLFAQNQWKREQFPVAMKVLELDLDPKSGFRFPVTQSIQDELDELAAAEL